MSDMDKDVRPKAIIRTVVPWHNIEEFLKVYEFLYSQDLEKKRWAVDQISVWETRCHPSLPTAIEASVVLSRAIIQDIFVTNETSLCKGGDIQLQYSMAIVRFVNLSIEEVHREERPPIAHVAQGLGLPTWIVDLRNEAIHSWNLTLRVLRMGAESCMKFLDKTFWSVKSARLRNIVKKPMNTKEFKELIIYYQVLQFKVFRGVNTESDDKDVKCNLKDLSECIGRNRQRFIEVLVEDGLFVTHDENLKYLLTKKELSDFYGAHSNKEGDEDEVSQPMLPIALEMFWEPLLRILNKWEVFFEFVEALLSTQGQRNHTGQRLITSWVIRILRFDIKPYLKYSIIAKMLRKHAPLFCWERLMYAAVSNPCIYTGYILPLITCHLDLKTDFGTSMMNLVAISQGQTVCHDLVYRFPKDYTAFTLDNLKQDNIDWKNLSQTQILLNSSMKDEPPVVKRPYNMFYSKEVKYKWTPGPEKEKKKLKKTGLVKDEEEKEEDQEVGEVNDEDLKSMVRGCLLKLTNLHKDCNREQIRDAFEPHGTVVYVDYYYGKPSGVLRFDSPIANSVYEKLSEEDGKRIIEIGSGKALVTTVAGNEEEEYLKFITKSRAQSRHARSTKRKFGNKGFGNKGGFKKWGNKKGKDQDDKSEPSKKRRKFEDSANNEKSSADMEVANSEKLSADTEVTSTSAEVERIA